MSQQTMLFAFVKIVILSYIMDWLKQSNRLKHLLYAIPIGLLGTILCVLGLATGMELKDKLWGGKWDWLDWLATILGGLVGQIIQLGIILLIVCL